MIWLWLGGLLRARRGRLAGSMAGVALTVALLTLLGAFIAQSGASMTARAVRDIPVDWQLQVVPGESLADISLAVAKAARVSRQQTVGFASVEGLQAQSSGTVQTTGAGIVLGLGGDYARDFPGQLRLLVGTGEGVLIAQQTAANLHVAPGDLVTIQRPGLTATEVRIDGVVDLPTADSLFQAIGVPPGAAPRHRRTMCCCSRCHSGIHCSIRKHRSGRIPCACNCTSHSNAASCRIPLTRLLSSASVPRAIWKFVSQGVGCLLTT